MNLLPKLRTLLDGQPVGSFAHFVDSSPKISDVKYDDKWHTSLIIGEGPGGTYYHSFDVTLAGHGVGARRHASRTRRRRSIRC